MYLNIMKNSLVPIKTLDLESTAPHLQGREVWQQVQHLEKSGQFHFCCKLCVFVFFWYALYFLEGHGLWLWLLLSSSLDLLHPAGGKSMSVPFQMGCSTFFRSMLKHLVSLWNSKKSSLLKKTNFLKLRVLMMGLRMEKNPSQLDFCGEV